MIIFMHSMLLNKWILTDLTAWRSRSFCKTIINSIYHFPFRPTPTSFSLTHLIKISYTNQEYTRPTMRSASVRSFWNCSLSASHEGISTSPRSIYRYVTIHFNITSHISILFFLFSWDVKSEKYSFYEVNIYTYCFHVIIFIIDNMSTFNLFYEFNF